MVCKSDTFKLAAKDSSNTNLKLCFRLNLRRSSQKMYVQVKLSHPQIDIQILKDKFLKIQGAHNHRSLNISLTFQG